MIYRVRSYDISASIGGALAQSFTEWMNKAVKFTNEKWPEVEAEYLRQIFHSGKHSFVTKHESVEASMDWYKTLMEHEGAKALMDELRSRAEKGGVPIIREISDNFYEISE